MTVTGLAQSKHADAKTASDDNCAKLFSRVQKWRSKYRKQAKREPNKQPNEQRKSKQKKLAVGSSRSLKPNRANLIQANKIMKSIVIAASH